MLQPVKPSRSSCCWANVVAWEELKQPEVRPLIWSLRDSCSSISATFWETIGVQPAGGFSLLGMTATPPRPLSYAVSGGAGLPTSPSQTTAQSAAGSPDVASTIESTPWTTQSTEVVSLAEP